MTSTSAAPAGRSIDQFAGASGLSVSTVRRLIRSGAVASVKVGARRLIPAGELDKLLAAGVERVGVVPAPTTCP